MEKLTADFYRRDTLTVARDLLGKRLVHVQNGVVRAGRITETEAYIGRMDKACHAYGCRRTPRTQTLFAPPGTAYVYLIYGMYHCLNCVTEAEGEPCAVLLRGVEPLEGRAEMALERYGRSWEELTPRQRRGLADGPGKLCRALGITREENGAPLTGDVISVWDDGAPCPPIRAGKRIGIDYAREAVHFPWRFWI